jgi:hypothetical protein
LKKKRVFLVLIVLVLAAGLLHGPVLRGLGRFLAPQGKGTAEAVVVEGDQVVQEGIIEAALALIREGRAGQIVAVLHYYPEKERLFAIQDQYARKLGEELERRGLRKGQYRIWETPAKGHPITLSEARYVVPRLAQAGIRKAYLVCQGFHTRRSFLVYQGQGDTLGIHFVPYPYFPSFARDAWWQDLDGVKYWGAEALKLIYYLGRGYIPLSALFHGSLDL